MKFIIFLLLIKLIVCLKNEEFCYQISTDNNNELENCRETHNFKCWNGLCSVGPKSCENLAVFLLIKKYGVNDFQKYKNKIETFMKQVKNCTEESKLISDNVCLNTKDCVHPPIHRLRLWSNQMSPNECKCNGKYSFRCNSEYCASNKRSCNEINGISYEIKKCKKNYINIL